MTANVSSSLEDFQHIETGDISCWSSEFSNGETSSRYKIVSQTFKQPYSRPPVVFLSVSRLLGHQSHDDIWYYVYVTSVSETQFSVECVAFDASQIREMWVSYLVIPQFE